MERLFFAFSSPPKCWYSRVPCILSSTSKAAVFMSNGSGLLLSASSLKSLEILALDARLVVGPLRLACDEDARGNWTFGGEVQRKHVRLFEESALGSSSAQNTWTMWWHCLHLWLSRRSKFWCWQWSARTQRGICEWPDVMGLVGTTTKTDSSLGDNKSFWNGQDCFKRLDSNWLLE